MKDLMTPGRMNESKVRYIGTWRMIGKIQTGTSHRVLNKISKFWYRYLMIILKKEKRYQNRAVV